jgi:hydroxyacylglutathione hydrolase
MNVLPIPAFDDNYIWLMHVQGRAVVVDPGDAQPVLDTLERLQLRLQAILVTHHHGDHTGGVDRLRQATGAQVYGPRQEKMPEPIERLGDGDQLELLGCPIEVIDVPGHTAGHIAYVVRPAGESALLFCGDTLFSAGCGRLFEGTPAQMLHSLGRLAALPDNTRVCCAHEYTASGLRFALAVEPDNAAARQYADEVAALRACDLPSLPSNIGREKAVNPFLRTHLPQVQAAIAGFDASASAPADVFGALRAWKNQF